MLQRIERIVAYGQNKIVKAGMDNFVADKKAELNFHFIMGMIKQKNLNKNVKLSSSPTHLNLKGDPGDN